MVGNNFSRSVKSRMFPGILAVSFAAPSVLVGADNSTNKAENLAIEEVLITAQRRVSTVQDTPLAIAAVSGNDLADQGITDLEGLQNSVPGLTLGDSFGLARITVRGVSTENFLGGSIGGDGGVSFNINGVPIGRPQGAGTQFYDIERVEVLRGPQGTLYGKNATGGAINVITARPSESFEGYIEGGYGNYSRTKFTGAVGGPLIENKLLGRFAFLSDQSDSTINNLNPTGDDNLGDRDLWSARGTLKAFLSDDLTFDFFAEYFHQDNAAGAYVTIPNVRGEPSPAALLGGEFGPLDPDKRTVNYDMEDTVDFREFLTVSGEFNWDFDAISLTSITAYHQVESDNAFDVDGSSVHYVNTEKRFIKANQFTQEIRVSSKDSEVFDWIAGFIYFKESSEADQDFSFPLFGTNFLSGGSVETRSIALFGEATWHASDSLSVTGGLRWTQDKKKGDETFYFGGISASQTLEEETWDAVTPRLIVDYSLSDDVLLYLSASKGFKSGGFNIGALQTPYEPEYITNYEFGVKSLLLDGRLQANISSFYYEYEDQQFTQILGVLAILTNAGQSDGYGLEADVTYRINESWKLDFDYAYLNAEFKEFDNIEDPFPELGVQDLSGNALPRAPQHKFNVGLEYEFNVFDRYDFTLRGEWSYTSETFFSEFNRSFASQDSVDIGNVFLRFEDPETNVYGRLYAKNITDETVISNSVVTAAVVGFTGSLNLNQPRTYGLEVGVRF